MSSQNSMKMSAIGSKKNSSVSPLNVNKCLPPELTVQSVEHILHRIGLTLDSTKSYPKRNLFFNPIIIFIFYLIIHNKRSNYYFNERRRK